MSSLIQTEQDYAIHAIVQTFMKVIGSAKSVGGAYERVQAQIQAMPFGGYRLPVSTEARIQVISIIKKCEFEDARTLLDRMSEEDRLIILQRILESIYQTPNHKFLCKKTNHRK